MNTACLSSLVILAIYVFICPFPRNSSFEGVYNRSFFSPSSQPFHLCLSPSPTYRPFLVHRRTREREPGTDGIYTFYRQVHYVYIITIIVIVETYYYIHIYRTLSVTNGG